MRQTEHGRLVEMSSQNLHADGQPLGCVAAGHAHSRDAREIARDGVNVGKVHVHWISEFLAQPESRERRHRRHDGIYFLKRLLKLASDEGPDLLRLQII